MRARARRIELSAMSHRQGGVPLESDRSILVLGVSGACLGLSRATGEVTWRNILSRGGGGEVSVAFRFGVVAVSAAGHALFRLDYRTGDTLWQAETSGGGRATIVVEPELIVVAKGGYVDAFGHDGSRHWRQPLKGIGEGRMALAFPGNVAQPDE
jgi:hypothetical protein